MKTLPKTLPKPELPEHLDANCKWLAGEGAGSWFQITSSSFGGILVKRFDPKGVLECENNYTSFNGFKIFEPYEITFPSHCAVITIIQEGRVIKLMA